MSMLEPADLKLMVVKLGRYGNAILVSNQELGSAH